MDNLSGLSERLREIEKGRAADRSGISDSRLAVVNAVEGYRKTRYRLGETLSIYKTFFIEQRGWLAVAKAIADALGCDERTIRRIVSDFERVSAVPAAVIKALENAGIDPAARRNATMIDRILRMPQKDLLRQFDLTTSLTREDEMAPERQQPHNPSRSEHRRLAVRKKIRAAVKDAAPQDKLALLLAAIEEEMYLEWGQLEPVTITITPHCHPSDEGSEDHSMAA